MPLRAWLLPLAFGVFGAVWGAWQAVLPDLAQRFGLSSGPLGLMLTAGFAVSLPAMLVSGRLLDRLGAGRVIALTAALMGVGLAGVATLASVPVLVVGVILFVLGSGTYDVAINGAALADGAWSRPARVTLLHAAFSGGGVVGAVGGGGVVAAGVSFALVYVVAAAALLGVAAVATGGRLDAERDGGAIPAKIAIAMLPLAVIAGLAFLVEGTLETWSAIYLRDVLGAAAFVGALGPGAFHAAMLVGRLVGVGVAGTLGAPATLLLAGGMTLVGMLVALLVPAIGVAIGGMAVAALGAAFVVPVVVSLAGRRAGGAAGRAASYVLTLGYAGFLVGPSIIGLLGELAGLRLALAVVPIAAATIALASRTSVARA